MKELVDAIFGKGTSELLIAKIIAGVLVAAYTIAVAYFCAWAYGRYSEAKAKNEEARARYETLMRKYQRDQEKEE